MSWLGLFTDMRSVSTKLLRTDCGKSSAARWGLVREVTLCGSPMLKFASGQHREREQGEKGRAVQATASQPIFSGYRCAEVCNC